MTNGDCQFILSRHHFVRPCQGFKPATLQTYTAHTVLRALYHCATQTLTHLHAFPCHPTSLLISCFPQNTHRLPIPTKRTAKLPLYDLFSAAYYSITYLVSVLRTVFSPIIFSSSPSHADLQNVQYRSVEVFYFTIITLAMSEVEEKQLR